MGREQPPGEAGTVRHAGFSPPPCTEIPGPIPSAPARAAGGASRPAIRPPQRGRPRPAAGLRRPDPSRPVVLRWGPRALVALLALLLVGAVSLPPGPARASSLWPGRPAVAPVEPEPALDAVAGEPGTAIRPVTVPVAGAGGSRPPRRAEVSYPLQGSPYPVPEGVAPLWRGVVAPPPATGAAAAVLMDQASGQVLFAHNPHQRRAPASTTKILTAIVALEFGNLDDVVTVSEHAAATEGSTMDLVAGERYSLRELLWGLMLESGNDAAVAIAEHIAGSEAAFARLMNETALRLGLRDTHFTNPHGLHDPAHFTTAYDLAVMTRYALANDYFARLVCQPEKVLCRGDGDWVRILSSTNRLLWYHEWIRGVKTGTTGAAGPCLVSSGELEGRRLIAVVLDSGDRWADSQALLEWGFEQFAPAQGGRAGDGVGQVAVARGRQPAVEARLAGDLTALVPPGLVPRVRRVLELARQVEAPVAAGQRLGTASLVLDGVPLARTAVVAAAGVDPAPWWRRWWPW